VSAIVVCGADPRLRADRRRAPQGRARLDRRSWPISTVTSIVVDAGETIVTPLDAVPVVDALLGDSRTSLRSTRSLIASVIAGSSTTWAADGEPGRAGSPGRRAGSTRPARCRR
jgi:hypothetical protein